MVDVIAEEIMFLGSVFTKIRPASVRFSARAVGLEPLRSGGSTVCRLGFVEGTDTFLETRLSQRSVTRGRPWISGVVCLEKRDSTAVWQSTKSIKVESWHVYVTL